MTVSEQQDRVAAMASKYGGHAPRPAAPPSKPSYEELAIMLDDARATIVELQGIVAVLRR